MGDTSFVKAEQACVRADPGSVSYQQGSTRFSSPVFLMKVDFYNHIICPSFTLSRIPNLLANSQTLKEISKAERILEGLRFGTAFLGEGVLFVFSLGVGIFEFYENVQLDKGRNVECKRSCWIGFAHWAVSTCTALAKASCSCPGNQVGPGEEQSITGASGHVLEKVLGKLKRVDNTGI